MALRITKGSKMVVYTEEHSTLINGDAIPSDAFSGNVELKSVKIPEGVTKILKDTFKGCENLSQVTIPASVKVIEPNAFAGCSRLKSVRLAKSVVEIEKRLGSAVKLTLPKNDLVDFLKKGEGVNLLSEDDIDHWA